MSDQEEHGADAGHAHPAPGIPEVRDEAGDTPAWVPKLGLALGVALAAVIAFLIATAEPTTEPAADEQTEAE